MSRSLSKRVLFITGASRGIGKAIALRAARDGARIVVAAKTAEPHPTLGGTIYTAAREIEDAGGEALPLVVDVRSEEMVEKAVAKVVEHFGGIDVVVNNASAIMMTDTLDTPMKRYDLLNQVNARGTFLVSQKCIPSLIKSAQAGRNPHILNICPPLLMEERWFAPHVAYSMAKFGMSMCVLGMAGELREQGIAVNGLWPRTAVHTAAVENVFGEELVKESRKPEIMADAAHWILQQPAPDCSGNFFVDDDVLEKSGIADFDAYSVVPGVQPAPDFFVNPKAKTDEERKEMLKHAPW
eukprot:CAMPEP_0113530700 /NCGR_PEP_ID=MMETSP0015_2-20120614/3087_1 /TAXON_ID=2838 /ORGANISM="Odontella" /LENGTH=296 /DNA_ID=CAMNT_0000429455 /DNA_START=25 /DNA_END=912 /DNA_ORIENTATION=+ /assembly_acc=CAM_ASM_000160